jgi:hydroxypyruvate isomerase
MTSNRSNSLGVSRRAFCGAAAAGFAALAPQARAGDAASATTAYAARPKTAVPPEDYRIQSGRIKHSVQGWCFDPLPTEELIAACHRMGMPAIEGIDRKHYPKVRELGMTISIVGSHGFAKGPLTRDNHAFCLAKLREAIDTAAEFGAPNVFTFTGMREKGVSDEQAVRNCLDCWKQVIGYAEQKQVNLCLEHLNTRDDTHPMKGHPGYFGDDVEQCIDMIQKVASPRMKLVFDVYHVQIMNGDVIRRIRKHKDYIGHIHTAGVPGRCELDENQEVNFPAVMRALLEVGYRGFVAHEFIPTWPDKLGALRHAVQVCDV